MNLAKNIRNARIQNKLSQKQLADKITELAKKNGYNDLSFGDTAISNWERGTSKPDADTIFLLCKALNVDANYLLDWEKTIATDNIKQALEKVLRENDFFDGDDLSEENLNKLIKFINANKEFIVNKKN